MPLYYYECSECEHVFELFQHNSEKIQVNCTECEHSECKRLLGNVHNRVKLNHRDNLDRRLLPDVDRIMTNMGKGSDKDFLDIAGD